MKEISRQKIYLLHDIRQPNWNLLTKKGERPLLRRLSTEVYELLNCQGTGVERGVVVKLLQLLHIEQLVEVSYTLREPHFGTLLLLVFTKTGTRFLQVSSLLLYSVYI